MRYLGAIESNFERIRVATVYTACGMYQLNSINNPRVNHFDLLGGFVS